MSEGDCGGTLFVWFGGTLFMRFGGELLLFWEMEIGHASTVHHLAWQGLGSLGEGAD